MNIRYKAQFLLDKERNKTDAKLRYRIKWDNNVVAFTVGYRVEIDKWSLETQRCKANTTHGKKKIPSTAINRRIQKYESACEKVFSLFEAKNKVPDIETFKFNFNTEIGRKPKNKEELSFFEVFNLFVEEESRLNQWTDATLQKMNVNKNRLYDFNPNLSFEDLTEDGLYEYLLFLQNYLKFKNSTTLKNISFLKWFLRWATKRGHNTNRAFEIFRPKLKRSQKKIIFLTPSEIKQLREYEIPLEKKYLERVRDVFLFQCFTGLRYSDVENLRKSDIKNGFIEITTVKTSDSLIIELNEHSRTILEKYKDYNYNNKALPVISNQRMNEYLKELAELAEIDEPIRETYYRGNKRIDKVMPKYSLIGTHAGRRTFICNALSLGIPPQVVMKWTGHSDYKAMKPYIDISDETKINAMEKFNLLE